MSRAGGAYQSFEEKFYKSEGSIRAKRDYVRRSNARKYGHLPPPKEKDCPPRPEDGGYCQCCGQWAGDLVLDHCHETGAFRGWVCNGCNTGFGLADDIERLEKRIAFLKNLHIKMIPC